MHRLLTIAYLEILAPAFAAQFGIESANQKSRFGHRIVAKSARIEIESNRKSIEHINPLKIEIESDIFLRLIEIEIESKSNRIASLERSPDQALMVWGDAEQTGQHQGSICDEFP